jgi:uncharacterized protein (TIGR03086 family)
MELDQLLERATEMNTRLIAGIRPDQYTNATPCGEWQVRDILDHIIGGNHFFAKAAAGEPVEAPAEPRDLVGDDPATAYAHGAKVALEAWRAPGVAERTVTLPLGDLPGAFATGIHFIDHFVHGWDLAKATGQEEAVDTELAESVYALVQGNIGDDRRQPGGPFGPEVPVSEEASTVDRLVAYLGRQP